MWQVNDRVFRVSSASGSVFTLEGEDTTNYDTFSSGTAQKITFGTSVTSATTLTSSGGNFAMIDTTTIHMNQKSQIPGLPDAATFDMDNIWDVSDAGLIAMKASYDAQAKRAFKFTFGTGRHSRVDRGSRPKRAGVRSWGRRSLVRFAGCRSCPRASLPTRIPRSSTRAPFPRG